MSEDLDPAAFDDVPESESVVVGAAAMPQWGAGKRRARPDDRRGVYIPWRARLKEKWAAASAPCGICDGKYGPIDYVSPHGAPNTFELDHVVPVSIDPSLAYEERNARPAHASCNRRRQAGGAGAGGGAWW